ncbi:MAG: hypothetical protein AAB209_06640, partial [Bacteroidota bacterium]
VSIRVVFASFVVTLERVLAVKKTSLTELSTMAELVPIQFENLLKRIYHEYTRTDSIFDLPSRKFYRPSGDVDLSVSFCGNAAANPVGPAAGPHTQLTQNIVLSWLAGSRIIELKSVQI